MIMKHCFIMIQGVSWNTFILIQCVSWPWNKLVSSWFSLIQHVSWLWNKMFLPDSTCFKVFHNHATIWLISDWSWLDVFHRSFITLIHAVLCWFNLLRHYFTTVSPVWAVMFHADSNCFTTVNVNVNVNVNICNALEFPKEQMCGYLLWSIEAKMVQVYFELRSEWTDAGRSPDCSRKAVPNTECSYRKAARCSFSSWTWNRQYV